MSSKMGKLIRNLDKYDIEAAKEAKAMRTIRQYVPYRPGCKSVLPNRLAKMVRIGY